VEPFLPEVNPEAQARRALIVERQEIVTHLSEIRELGERPVIEGVAKTNKAGLSLEYDGDEPVIGFHVIDSTLIMPGSELDLYGYGQQQSIDGKNITYPLFGDRILSHHLGFALHDNKGSGNPAISFSYGLGPDGLEIRSMNFTLFNNVSSPSRNEATVAKAIQELIKGVVPKAQKWNVQDIKKYLGGVADGYVSEIIDDAKVTGLRDPKGRISIQDPIHEWVHHKNQELLTTILAGEVPLYSNEQFNHMQRRTRGYKHKLDRSDILPDKSALVLTELIGTSDFSKRTVSDEDFSKLIDRFYPSDSNPDPLLSNIWQWAERKGFMKLDTVPEAPRLLRLNFHNLPMPVDIHVDDAETEHELAYEVLLGFLRQRRIPPKDYSGRHLLIDLTENARSYGRATKSEKRVMRRATDLIRSTRRR
jgi:hypothetical protein